MGDSCRFRIWATGPQEVTGAEEPTEHHDWLDMIHASSFTPAAFLLAPLRGLPLPNNH